MVRWCDRCSHLEGYSGRGGDGRGFAVTRGSGGGRENGEDGDKIVVLGLY